MVTHWVTWHRHTTANTKFAAHSTVRKCTELQSCSLQATQLLATPLARPQWLNGVNPNTCQQQPCAAACCTSQQATQQLEAQQQQTCARQLQAVIKDNCKLCRVHRLPEENHDSHSKRLNNSATQAQTAYPANNNKANSTINQLAHAPHTEKHCNATSATAAAAAAT
jgi:hypothetical protein